MTINPMGRTYLVAAIAAALGASVNQVASAQTEGNAGQQRAGALEEIVTTGTRIRRDDFSNPQPTTVIGGEMIRDLGLTNIGDVVAQMPSNVGSWTPTAK